MTGFWLAYSGLNKLIFFSYKILCNFAVKGYTCNQKYKTSAEVDKIGSAGQVFSAKPDKLSWMPGTNMAEEIWLHKIVLWPQHGHHIHTNTQISKCNLNLEKNQKSLCYSGLRMAPFGENWRLVFLFLQDWSHTWR